jgi:glycosyltransferase involved in cell wall biosynthesis
MPLRVLHCPNLVGGHAPGLAAAERELGVDSWTLALEPSPYGYPADEVVWDRGDGRVVRELKRLRLLPRVLRDFDVVHFNFGSTLMPGRLAREGLPAERAQSLRMRVLGAYWGLLQQLDLPLLDRAGKAIFVTFQGDDARQGDVATRRFPQNVAGELEPGYYSPRSDENKRQRIARFDRYASGIYALNPDLLRVLPARARFVPYANLDPQAWAPSAPKASDSRPRVLHAPTNRGIKGTRFLAEAVARLQAEGVDFEFELVTGRTRVELKSLYESADVVVDQLLLGWYGGLAVEAMALERPVVAYIREADLSFVPAEMRAEIPVVQAEPRTIHEVLRQLLTERRGELAELGRRSRDYVCRWHDPGQIARELVPEYEAAVARRRR